MPLLNPDLEEEVSEPNELDEDEFDEELEEDSIVLDSDDESHTRSNEAWREGPCSCFQVNRTYTLLEPILILVPYKELERIFCSYSNKAFKTVMAGLWFQWHTSSSEMEIDEYRYMDGVSSFPYLCLEALYDEIAGEEMQHAGPGGVFATFLNDLAAVVPALRTLDITWNFCEYSEESIAHPYSEHGQSSFAPLLNSVFDFLKSADCCQQMESFILLRTM
ncbi:hypothetical protein EON65_12270 [archaeon]|nr:MAG: hypothetical protein EON65_12270 [archaeon]